MAEIVSTPANPHSIHGYGAGDATTSSSIDRTSGANTGGAAQMNQYFYDKAALIALRTKLIFSQMSSTRNMPKHYGDTLKKHVYVPLLDEANLTDQGLDKNGAYTAKGGRLYGGSKNIGTILSSLPDISETGGRVNRVGFTRREITAQIVNRGFFFEYSSRELDFDSDKDLYMHLTTEALRGAQELNEDILAATLISGAGYNHYAAGAVLPTGGTYDPKLYITATSRPSIMDLYKMDTQLDHNKCPKDTEVIAGSRMIDTRTVENARYMFISSDVKTDFMSMKDLDGTTNAFIPLKTYSHANTDKKYISHLHGEIGMVGPFRLVVVPKMLHYEGAGALKAGGTGARTTVVPKVGGGGGTEERYNVYPCLIIGSGCFTHIGFETGSGAKSKFIVKNKRPGAPESIDPYGKTGLTSIQFWNGVLIERPEWLATYNISASM